MLVLTRKPNQSIMIGDDIEVSVLSVVGEKVRIGIQAPARRAGVPHRDLRGDPSDQQRHGERRHEAARGEVDEALRPSWANRPERRRAV